MNKESKIGPYLMNVFHFVLFDHHSHTHLSPCRHTNNITDILFTTMFYYLILLFFPILQGSNSSSRFIKCLEPEWPLLSENATKITGIPTGFSFLQIRSAADHKKAFCHCIVGKIFIIKKSD